MNTTKFNKKYPNAYNITIDSNNLVWGVWFNTKGKNHRTFVPIDFKESEGIIETELVSNSNSSLYEEDRILCLN